MCDRALLSWTWLNTSPQMGSSEEIPHFALLACVIFDLPIKLFLSQLQSFITLTLIIVSLILLGGK